MTKVLMTMGLPSDRSHEQSANIEFANSISSGTETAFGGARSRRPTLAAENLPLMLGRTSDGARPHLTTRLCINSCIYLWTAIRGVFWAESNFRFRCYRTPNVADMTGVLSSMAEDKHPVTPGLVARVSPYTREHIRRFGQYVLNMNDLPGPLQPRPLPFEPAL